MNNSTQNKMTITCPSCNASYEIPEQNVPETKFAAKCKKCGKKFVIDHHLQEQKIPEQKTLSPKSEIEPEKNQIENQEEQISKILEAYPGLAEFSQEKFALSEVLSPSPDGNYLNSKNNFKVKILKAVHNILGSILTNNEKVMRVGRGTAYYPSEIPYANGIMTLFYNYYAIVCTNKKILLFNVNFQLNRPTRHIFQIHYESIKKIKRGIFFNSLIFCLKDGSYRNFTTVKRFLSKELQYFINAKKDSQTVNPEYSMKTLENLCPSCFTPLTSNHINCPQCNIMFKEPRQALLKSLVMPGWGSLYLGHTGLGIIESTGAALLWALLIFLFVNNMKEGLIAGIIILLFYNSIDSLLSYSLARKGYIPTE
ncbi:MAG: zinc-ribbon domain-containing protein [Proteobacteria bacterium]|nr:zinc-ribbon domain-containing protein [Pseudomonadota bacterium]MBU1714080.1 zinc-ribbon domain-containing protein [Pseudomonadota bacterium]